MATKNGQRKRRGPKCGQCNAVLRNRRALANHLAQVHAAKGKIRLSRPRVRESNVYGTTTRPMTTLIPNQAIRSGLDKDLDRMIGLTSEGRAWARRALHPCDDSLGGCMPVPDDSDTYSTAIEVRSSVVLTAPDSAQNWDAQILALPLADVPYVYRKRVSGNANWGFWTFPAGSVNQSVGPGEFQLAYSSTVAAPITTPGLIEQSNQSRTTHRGITCILNSSALNNQGLVTAGQWGSNPITDRILPNYSGAQTPSEQEVTAYAIGDVPSTSAELLNVSPSAGQWEARKGTYMPIRFSDPVHLYKGGQESAWKTSGNTIVQTGALILLRNAAEGAAANFANDLVFSDEANGKALMTACSANLNMGTMMYEGLSGTATLLVRSRGGIEFVPTSESALAMTTKEPPQEDVMAIKAVHTIQRKLPIVYEHKYNSFNLLLPLLKRAAHAALPILGRLFTNMSGIPLS